MESFLLTKIFIAFGTFFISFISAVAPLKVINIDDRMFSVGNMVASGILFSAGIVHQLPDSTESLKGYLGDFPLASFLAGLTFAAFLILEEYLHTQFEDNPFEAKGGQTKTKNDLHIQQTSQLARSSVTQQQPRQHNELSTLIAHSNARTSRLVYLTSRSSLCENNCCGDVSESPDEAINSISTPRRSLTPSLRRTTGLESMKDYTFGYEHPVHYHEEHLADHAQGSLLSSILLLGALSFHSLFEALAIGVATSGSTITTTTSAVLAHKAFAGYALGSAMVASHMKKFHVVILSFVFGFCSIVGVFLGIFLQTFFARNGDAQGSQIFIGTIQAMVTGTFLYVSIVEIAMKELMTHREGGSLVSSQRCQVCKLAAFLVGYLMMSALAIWV